MTIEPVFYTSIERGYEGMELLHTTFENALRTPKRNDRIHTLFDDVTIQKIKYFFKKLAIPLPDSSGQFLCGTEGVLVASSKYGLVTRIELTHPMVGYRQGQRINTSGYVLKPIAAIDAGRATIEVCPGIRVETNTGEFLALNKRLRESHIEMWDNFEQIENSGRVPVKTPHFPEGVPVVLDRLAVAYLSAYSNTVKSALEKEAEEAQDTLYSPLRKAFKDAWEHGRTRQLWELCRTARAHGTLVAGWDSKECFALYHPYRKTLNLSSTAKEYDTQKLSCP